jgi:hypothetical protein
VTDIQENIAHFATPTAEAAVLTTGLVLQVDAKSVPLLCFRRDFLMRAIVLCYSQNPRPRPQNKRIYNHHAAIKIK